MDDDSSINTTDARSQDQHRMARSLRSSIRILVASHAVHVVSIQTSIRDLKQLTTTCVRMGKLLYENKEAQGAIGREKS